MTEKLTSRLRNIAITLLLCLTPAFSSAQPTLLLDDALSDRKLNEIRQVVDDVTERYLEVLGYQFQPSTIMVFSSNPSFLAREHTNSTGSSYAENIQAFQNWINAEAGYRRVYVHVGKEGWQNRQDRRPLIAHELFHILQNELIGRRSQDCCKPDRVGSVGPTWLSEGSANYYEHVILGRDTTGYIQFARRQIADLQGRPLSILETRDGMNSVANSYDIGAYAVSILVDTAGPSSIFSFYQGLGRGNRWQRAFEDAFSIKPQTFYENFR